MHVEIDTFPLRHHPYHEKKHQVQMALFLFLQSSLLVGYGKPDGPDNNSRSLDSNSRLNSYPTLVVIEKGKL